MKQKRWETRKRRAGEIAFVYQNNKRNESVTLASKIWKIDGKGFIYLENQAFSTVNLRLWFRLRARLVTCKSAKIWYLMRMCISWLCPFKLFKKNKKWDSFAGNEYVTPSTVTTVTTEAETTIKANTTNVTSNVASTTVKRTATAGNSFLKHKRKDSGL